MRAAIELASFRFLERQILRGSSLTGRLGESVQMGVITSYSIHYTKLYDLEHLLAAMARPGAFIAQRKDAPRRVLGPEMDAKWAKLDLRGIAAAATEAGVNGDLLADLLLRGPLDAQEMWRTLRRVLADGLQNQDGAGDELIRVAAAALAVITSYSIHYTKLYELGQPPAGQSIGGKALMENHERAFEILLLQIGVKGTEMQRHHQPFISDGLTGEGRNIEIPVSYNFV